MSGFGLLGRKLGHSFSPRIHALLADYAYGLYEVEPSSLDSFLSFTGLQGMNVTIPYKKIRYPFLRHAFSAGGENRLCEHSRTGRLRLAR